ncbi:MliC family protein [Iodobacter sp. CM08]|uniref:MliC family protein n=1 Tax=Iodobacter sp. CM08 TaxID=3085902 RepID=UPI002981F568|nr:MliC family protein [Iodobacter sp. CM08]MDW5415399.1 MliC family protein [Iodobacter sp. CM08]
MLRILALMLLSGTALATPDEITGRYQCGSAQFYITSSADMEQVRLRVDGRIYDLPAMRTASGAAWSDGEWIWWTKGADSFLERQSVMVAKDCLKKPVK